MAVIDDYARDIQRVLIDAAQDEVFRNFIDATDLESVVIDLGDGTQAQAQALKRSSVREVLQRLMAAAARAGVDLKHWICSADEFDLCRKLANSFPGAVMRELHDFLRRRWTPATTVALGAVAAFAQIAAVLTAGKFLAILAAIGFVNKEFLELCNCATA